MLRSSTSSLVRSTTSNILKVQAQQLTNVRSISTTPTLLAKPPAGAVKGGKKAVAFTRKSQKVNAEEKKPKKSGMTHYGFKDAIRNLKLESNASEFPNGIVPLTGKELIELSNGSKIKSYPEELQLGLTISGCFKKYQFHEMFKTPVSFISSNLTQLNSKFIEELTKKPSKDNRFILTGAKGCGKSTLITQAIVVSKTTTTTAADSRKIVVLHLDDASLLRNGTSDYIKNDKLNKYQQPMLTKRFIRKIVQLNKDIFKTLKLSKDIIIPTKTKDLQLKANENTLYEYLTQTQEFARGNPTNAFQFFIEQLQFHSQQDKGISVFTAIDDINSIIDYPETLYKHPDFTPIMVDEFELGNFVLQTISGELSFAKGGVLLATSSAYNPQQTLQVALDPTKFNAYEQPPKFYVDYADKLLLNNGVKQLPVANFSFDEAEEWIRFLNYTGIVVNRPDYIARKPKKLDASGNVVKEEEVLDVGFDEVDQLDKITRRLYVASQGNPYDILKASILTVA
ncbi:uncharacterized protein J8A68_005654 [[Candida] subhashii]|uniref:Small ribosomal subunit protein mS29 n=1 Tax=[Candida] subhashii TaxID=561895 RepID=A0A8J5QC67_9ASCO|nr:uncharacterized protein J8A68_005654 [[Candida] subhashii]KAG7660837.1 hypothetical protein J8A68_005654 [[Candida] subhashii]